MIVSYYVVLFLIYIIGIPCYLSLVCEELDENCKLYKKKATPKQTRQSLIWPIFLLWVTFIAIILLAREVIWPFILTLIGRTK